MIYRERHHTFLQQLTRMAQRAHKWAMIGLRMRHNEIVIRHKGDAY